MITTVADGYAPISLLNAVVPFTSRYRPIWLGLGAVAFDLLLALTITSLLRARIGYRTWRGAALARVRVVADRARARPRHRQRRAHGAGCSSSLLVCVASRRRARCSGVSPAHGATPGAAARAATVRCDRRSARDRRLVLSGPAQARLGGAGGHAGVAASRSRAPRRRARRHRAAADAAAGAAFTSRFNGRVHESRQDANGRVLVDISGTTTRRRAAACSGSGCRASRSTAAASP